MVRSSLLTDLPHRLDGCLLHLSEFLHVQLVAFQVLHFALHDELCESVDFG
jgi:hypothetical protein